MTASDRIQTLVQYMGTNVKALSALCGYDRPQAFYDILKGKTRNISPTMCEKILTVFPRVSKIWLMTGEGEMLDNRADISSEDKRMRQQVWQVPLVHISAIAGPLRGYYEDGEMLSQCEYVNSPVSGADLALPVSGDSMEPMIPDGAVIFIKRINEAAFIPWGQALVIDTENGAFVKKVMPDNDDHAYLWAESINPKYPAMHVPTSAIRGMYRILNVSKAYYTM